MFAATIMAWQMVHDCYEALGCLTLKVLIQRFSVMKLFKGIG